MNLRQLGTACVWVDVNPVTGDLDMDSLTEWDPKLDQDVELGFPWERRKFQLVPTEIIAAGLEQAEQVAALPPKVPSDQPNLCGLQMWESKDPSYPREVFELTDQPEYVRGGYMLVWAFIGQRWLKIQVSKWYYQKANIEEDETP